MTKKRRRHSDEFKARVVLKPGESATEEEIIEYCKALAADYKKPRSVDFIDELPRNPSGKILKRTLREPYWKDKKQKVSAGGFARRNPSLMEFAEDGAQAVPA